MSLRRLARVGLLGLPLPLLGTACSHLTGTERTQAGPMHSFPDSPVDPAMFIGQVDPPVETDVPQPEIVRASDVPEPTIRASDAPAAPTTAATRQQLPIGLDTVLRLAEEQNPQIGMARAKVCVASAEKDVTKRWFPDIYVGMGYYRHQGGIQLQEGPLIRSSTGALQLGPQLNAEYNPRDYAFRQIEAARKVWQNQGDLTKVTIEQLLEASTAYIDLLTVHAALAISKDLEAKVKEALVKAVKLYDMFKTAEVEIDKTRVEAELTVQQQTQMKLNGQKQALSAKLAYLLGLDPSVELVPTDSQMTAFHLIDINRPVDELVSQALATGPGLRELESILCLIQSGLDTAGRARYVPIIKLQMGEGLFAAGQGGTLDWANRFDMGLQARWNVTDLLSAKAKKGVAFAQMSQVQMTVQELRAKLTLGVQEARSTIDASNQQFPSSETLIKAGRLIVEKAQLRKEEGVEGATFGDVVSAHKAVALAQLNYIDQMRDYDKAQLRLLVLLGR